MLALALSQVSMSMSAELLGFWAEPQYLPSGQAPGSSSPRMPEGGGWFWLLEPLLNQIVLLLPSVQPGCVSALIS